MSATLVPSSSAPSQGFDASSSASPATQIVSVYVGDLRPEINEKDLLEVFKVCGNIRSVRIPRDITTGASLCYGYVNFDSMDSANRAVADMNGYRIKGVKPCRVMLQEHDSSKRNSLEGKIFIKGLREDVDTRALQAYMSRYGDIYSCVVKTDAEGKSLRYGFCQFQNSADAEKVLNDSEDCKPSLGEEACIAKFLPPGERPTSRDRYTNVYIKGFDKEADEAVVRDLFKDCGEVTSWFFARDGESDETAGSQGPLRGFCFANFKDHELAVKTVEKFGEGVLIAWVGHRPQSEEETKKILEKYPGIEKSPKKEEYPADIFVGKLVACRAMTKDERQKLLEKDHPKVFPSVDERRCIYIKNIPADMTEADLIEFFSKFGELDTFRSEPEPKINVVIPRDKITGAIRGHAYVTFKRPEDCSKALSSGSVVVKSKRLVCALAETKAQRQSAEKMMALQGNGMFSMVPAPYGVGSVPFGIPVFAMAGGNPVGIPSRMNRGFPMNNGRSSNGPNARRSQTRNNQRPGGASRGVRTHNAEGGARPRNNMNNARSNPHKASAAPVAEPVHQSEEVTAAPAVETVPEEEDEVRSPADLKQRLGERIYERVMGMYEDDEPRWGKLTGMLIESIDVKELEEIVQDEEKLVAKIREANDFYEEHVNRPSGGEAQQ